MMKKLLVLICTLALILCGCSAPGDAGTTQTPQNPSQDKATVPPELNVSDLFSDRDYKTEYDESRSAYIELKGNTASCASNAVSISGSTVTIRDEGTYVLSGSLHAGMIIVDADKTDKVQLVLRNAAIHSESSAAIYICQADKVFISLEEGTENSLSNGGSFTAIDDSNIDAVIFSKEDLTLNGQGSLTITSPGGHGVVSKDELTVTGGVYQITAASSGLNGKDNVCIAGGSFTITSGKDGIHAENDEDTSLGFVYINNGTFLVQAEGDGISAGAYMVIEGGTYEIVTGGGSENGQQQTSGNWGGNPGAPGGRPGGMGGRPGGGRRDSGYTATTTEDDATSIKGLKAAGGMTIRGGTFTIDSADDAIHSNASLSVSDGSFTIETGDDGFHADEALLVSGGTINITESYEGLEGLTIDITGGDIKIVASDDGLNAAGGMDQSGFGGNRGGDMFGGNRGNTNSYIRISGGSTYINASGDGIDSNGSLEISGGTVTVFGPTRGDTAVLDYDSTGTITGGTFIGTGSMMMAQSLKSTRQGVLALSVGNQSAGVPITLTDSSGKQIVSFAPNLDFAIVIISTPEMVKGETYTITLGTDSNSFTAQ